MELSAADAIQHLQLWQQLKADIFHKMILSGKMPPVSNLITNYKSIIQTM
jgi:hypothetical protein